MFIKRKPKLGMGRECITSRVDLLRKIDISGALSPRVFVCLFVFCYWNEVTSRRSAATVTLHRINVNWSVEG